MPWCSRRASLIVVRLRLFLGRTRNADEDGVTKVPLSLLLLCAMLCAALLATPAMAGANRPAPLLSHESLDDLENKLGMLGLIGLLGLFGLRRRDRG